MNTLRTGLGSAFGFCRRIGYLARAAAWATLLGIIETLGHERGRRVLAAVVLVGGTGAMVYSHPVRIIQAGEAAVRVNHVTGSYTPLREGWAFFVPGIHELHRYSLRDQILHLADSARADGGAPFQSVEGLSIGVDVTVRYALDAANLTVTTQHLPDDVGKELVLPVVDGILRRIFASHTVREIFSTERAPIQEQVAAELQKALGADGVAVKAVFIGNVDLPPEYKQGIEKLLAEELSTEKMRYTLELKEKQIKETSLDAEADKVRRTTAAEALGQEEIIAAKAKEEAMAHVLPFKEKEIEQRRLEAEASKITRIKQAEGEAEARRLEGAGEADYRRKLADSDAYRTDVTGKALADQLGRESKLIAANPLLIQKTLADKLSDKIQVIVAPPQAGGFFAGGLLGMKASAAGDANAAANNNVNRDGEE